MNAGLNRVANTKREKSSDIQRTNDKPTEAEGLRIREIVRRSFLVVLGIELALIISWFALNVVMGFIPEIESTLAFSAIGLSFTVVGWVIAGLPLALIARHRGWDKTYKIILPLGGAVGGLTSTLLTYAFFIDAPEVAIAFLRMTLPLGVVAGLAAVLAWSKLAGPTPDKPR